MTNQGKTRRIIIDKAFDADKLFEFLASLIQDAGQKMFLILDKLRVHHSMIVEALAAERNDQIELFYLPSYDRRKSLWDSPQLNPEELNGQSTPEAATRKLTGELKRISRRGWH